MALTKQPAFTKKTTDLPDVPSPTYTPTQIKEYIQNPSDELMTNFNNAIDKLNATTDGNSGADNIGATGFDGTPSNPQTMLEDLNTRKADKGTDWSGTWQGFNPSQVDQTIRDQVNTNTSQLTDIAENVKYPPAPLVGAKGDGTTDDTQAINNIVNNAITNGGKKTFLFDGTFLVSGSIAVRGTELQLMFLGKKGSKFVKGTGNYAILDLDTDQSYTGGYGQRIQDIYIGCIDFESPDSTGTAIKLRTFGRIFIDDVYAYRFDIAYDFQGGSEGYFNKMRWAGGNLGLKLDALSVDMQTVYFDECSFNNGLAGIDLSNAYEVRFTKTIFNALSNHHVKADTGTQNIYFTECYLEWGNVPVLLFNEFLNITFDKCEFSQIATGAAIPIQVNNAINNGVLKISKCYHEMIDNIPLVSVKESSNFVKIVLDNNSPEIVNQAIGYEKTVNSKTIGMPLKDFSLNQFNQDFTKGFLGYDKTATSVTLSLDTINILTGTNSVKFDIVNGYWDIFKFTNYDIDVNEGDIITLDVIIKGTNFTGGIVRGVLDDSSVVILESGGHSSLVESYPNGFNRYVIRYTVPKGRKLNTLRISNSQNPAVNLYLDSIDIRLSKSVKVDPEGTAIPTEGTFVVGDTLKNSMPAASGYMGWVCTTAGTPGTWKGYGLIQA